MFTILNEAIGIAIVSALCFLLAWLNWQTFHGSLDERDDEE